VARYVVTVERKILERYEVVAPSSKQASFLVGAGKGSLVEERELGMRVTSAGPVLADEKMPVEAIEATIGEPEEVGRK